MIPKRLQIQSLAAHPQAVRVDRATMWGNPFRADRPTSAAIEAGARTAAEAFDLWLGGHPALADIEPERRAAILKSIGRLHGRDLACWCPPGADCHADVLLRRAAAAEPQPGDVHNRPDGVPHVALSVRQPWAWALIYGGKDVENRSEIAIRRGGMRAQIGKRIAIHAAKGMTRDEYERARVFMFGIGVTCPAAADLERGGIIGSAFLASVVSEHTSPWFFGPRGLCLIYPEPVPFIGATGELGMFAWSPNYAKPEPPAKWMQPSVRGAAALSMELPL
jgi:hypothetical protein